MKRLFWFSMGVIATLFFLFVFGYLNPARASREQHCLCHNVAHNPHEVCSDDDSYKEGHQRHLDRGSDTLGHCPAPTVTPTPTPFQECDGDCEVTPTPSPEPTPTVVCTGNCGDVPTFAGSSTNAPQCGSSAPQAVDNPHVYRKGDVAVVKWFPKDGNMVHIYYKQVSSPDWQYSVTVPNTGYFEITGLGTLDISFAVQAVNDCSGGTSVMSKVIVDGAEGKWVLFR